LTKNEQNDIIMHFYWYFTENGDNNMFFTTKNTQVSQLGDNSLISTEHWLVGLAINRYTGMPTIYIEGVDEDSGAACLHECTLTKKPDDWRHFVQLIERSSIGMVAHYEEDNGSLGVSKFKPKQWGFEQLRLINIDVNEDDFRQRGTCLVQ
jgi:hypothetical protein